jgi:hypothetical protein
MADSAGTRKLPYFLIGASSLLVGLFAGWTPIAARIDNYYYDWLLMLNKPETGARDTYVVEIDDQTLIDYKGPRQLRRTMARALEVLAGAQPKAVAIDLILADEDDAEADALLASAMAKVPNLVLSSDIMRNADRWEEPYAPFAKEAKAIGHVHADLDQYDGVSRQVQLEKVAERKRRWAMALEAYRLASGGGQILESERDLEVAGQRLPFPRRGDRGRPMLIRYRWTPLPRISLKTLIEQPGEAARLKGKVVFLGVTSLSQARDRWVTPYSTSMGMPGVEIQHRAGCGGAGDRAGGGVRLFGRMARLCGGGSAGAVGALAATCRLCERGCVSDIGAGGVRVAERDRVRIVSVLRGAQATAPHGSRPEPVSAGHPFRFARDEIAADSDSGFERIDEPLQLDGGKAQEDRADDPQRVEAAGENDPDVPGCGAAGGRANGTEEGTVCGGGYGDCLRGAGAAAGGREEDRARGEATGERGGLGGPRTDGVRCI